MKHILSKSSSFEGGQLKAKTAEDFTIGKSKNSIIMPKNLKLSAHNKSEIDLLNSTEIDLLEFLKKLYFLKKNK